MSVKRVHRVYILEIGDLGAVHVQANRPLRLVNELLCFFAIVCLHHSERASKVAICFKLVIFLLLKRIRHERCECKSGRWNTATSPSIARPTFCMLGAEAPRLPQEALDACHGLKIPTATRINDGKMVWMCSRLNQCSVVLARVSYLEILDISQIDFRSSWLWR